LPVPCFRCYELRPQPPEPATPNWGVSTFSFFGRDWPRRAPALSVQKHDRQMRTSSRIQAKQALGLRGLFHRHWLLVDELFISWTRPSKSPDARFNTVGKSGKDDDYKFSLPTGVGFPENTLKGGARRLITDAKFDRSGSKCFSPDEVKCQPGLSERQAKVTPQPIKWTRS
jgi:hypothetical protein